MSTDVLQSDFLNEKSKMIISKLDSEVLGEVFKHKLTNGINAIFIKDEYEHLNKFMIFHRIGSKDEPLGKKGLAHLYEHLAFRAKVGKEQINFSEASANISTTINGSTTFSNLFFYSEFPPKNLEKYIDLEVQRLGNVSNTITDSDIAKELEIIRNECNQEDAENPLWGIQSAIRSSLFKKRDPRFYPVIGIYSDLESVTIEDVAKFENSNIRPDSCSIIVIGDYKPKQLFNILEQKFGAWRGSAATSPASASFPTTLPGKTKHFYYKDSRIRKGLSICYNAPKELSIDAVFINMAIQYLKIRNATYTYTYFTNQDQGMLSITNYNKPCIDSYLQIQNILKNIVSEEISDSDFEQVKMAVLGELLMDVSVKMRMVVIAKLNLQTGNASFSVIVDWIKNVTKEDFKEAIKKWFLENPHVTLTLMQENDKDYIFPESKQIKIDKSWQTPLRIHPGEAEQQDTDKYNYAVNTIPELDEKCVPIWNFKLQNGVKVYGSTIKKSRRVSGAILVMIDRSVEPQGLSGINMYCAEMLKRPKWITAKGFKERLIKLNAKLNIITYQSWIDIRYSTDRENLNDFFKLLAYSFLNPGINKKEIKNIVKETDYKKSTLKAIFSYDSLNVFKKLIYGVNSCYSQYSSGKEIDRKNINTYTLKKYFDANITPDVTRITITGNISKKEIREAVIPFEEWSGRHPARKITIDKDCIEPSEVFYVDEPGAENVLTSLYRKSPPNNTREMYILLLANDLLGLKGEKNLLFRNLRTHNGLSYNARSLFYTSGQLRFFCAEATSNLSNAALTYKILTDTVFKYAENFTEDMFRHTIRDEIVKWNSTIMTPERQNRVLLATAESHPSFHQDRFRASILKTITYNEMLQNIRKYFNPNEFYIVIVGDKAKIKPEIEKIGIIKGV